MRNNLISPRRSIAHAIAGDQTRRSPGFWLLLHIRAYAKPRVANRIGFQDKIKRWRWEMYVTMGDTVEFQRLSSRKGGLCPGRSGGALVNGSASVGRFAQFSLARAGFVRAASVNIHGVGTWEGGAPTKSTARAQLPGSRLPRLPCQAPLHTRSCIPGTRSEMRALPLHLNLPRAFFFSISTSFLIFRICNEPNRASITNHFALSASLALSEDSY